MLDIRERMTERVTAWAAGRLAKRAPHAETNRFLEGAYAPVQIETTEYRLDVTGRLPVELDGLLTRIGPNPISVKNPGAYHWFTGDGMVHGLRVADGAALWYRNRYVGSDSVQKALGRPKVPGRRRGIIDTVNTNAIGIGGRLFAVVEGGGFPVELDPDLESIRHGLFDSDLSLPFTAHPHVDPATGDAHAIVYDGIADNRIWYVVVDATCRVKHVAEIPVRDGPMIHDCAITASRVVILDLPVTLSVKAFAQGMSFPYRWNEKHAARVGLIPHGGTAAEVRWFSVDPCFVFHTFNAYDLPDGGAILDVVVHDKMFADQPDGPDSTRTTIERWTLDAASGTVRRRVRDERKQEFPRFDERRAGRAYRYGYTIGHEMGNLDGSSILRYDLETGAVIEHAFGTERIASEAVFVPRSATSAEDDGWLLSYVYDHRTDRSDVVVLDAANLASEPVALVHIPARVPLGFHGNWVPS